MHQWFLSYQVRAPLLIVVPPTIFLSPPCVMVFIWVYLSLQFSRSVMSDSLPPRELQHAKPPYPSPTPGVHPNPCPLSRWCQPSHSPSFPSPPALSVSQHQGLFKWVSSSHQVAKILEFHEYMYDHLLRHAAHCSVTQPGIFKDCVFAFLQNTASSKPLLHFISSLRPPAEPGHRSILITLL